MKTKLLLSVFLISLLPSSAFAELSDCNGVWTNDACTDSTETLTETHDKVVPTPAEPEVVKNNNPAPTETVINNNQGTNNPTQNSHVDENDGEGTDVQVNYGGGEYTNRRLPEGDRKINNKSGDTHYGQPTKPVTSGHHSLSQLPSKIRTGLSGSGGRR